MEDLIEKGISGTKELLGKAKDKARDLGQKGILTLEIGQLERQAHSELSRLGTQVYDALVSKQQGSVGAEDPEVKKHLDAVQNLKTRIEEKEEDLKKLRQKEGDA
jgi:hypothetical protein